MTTATRTTPTDSTANPTNLSIVGNALQLLAAGLGPYVTRKLQEAAGQGRYVPDDIDAIGDLEGDVAVILKVMAVGWNDIFRDHLGPFERSLVGEIRETRNRWAHLEPFDEDDLDRALDSVGRLLDAVSAAPEAQRVNRAKHQLRRKRYASASDSPAPASRSRRPASPEPTLTPEPALTPENRAAPESETPQASPAADVAHKYADPTAEPPPAPSASPVPDHSDRVQYLLDHGAGLRQSGQLAPALADFEEAIGLDRENAAAWYQRGLTLGHMGEYKQAINDINRALSINRNYADAYNARGYARFCIGDFARAVHDFEDALQLDPDDELARVNLDLARRRLENRDSR